VTGYVEIVAAATVGLAQRPLQVTALTGPAAAHQDVLPADPAGAALTAAALFDAAQRAGGLRPEPVILPPPAPDDPAPELSAAGAEILAEVLAAGDREVLVDLLELAGGAGVRAPAPALPALLALAAPNRALREPVAAVLGARGRWLAAQHPEWRRVVDAAAAVLPPDAWETGFLAERVAWLREQRVADPAAAREVLAAAWPRENGDDRSALLGALAVRLAPADEVFLQQALDDRRADVREQARRLLARLPSSAFVARAVDRASTVLSEHHGEIVVALPPPPDAAARRDGLTPVPPEPAVGEAAWWLFQVVARAPLWLWLGRLGETASEIVARPVAGEFAAELRAAWRAAAVREGDPEWAAALLAVPAPTPLAVLDARLTELLPGAERVERAVAVLAGERPGTIADVAACPAPWPVELTDAVLGYLGTQLRAGAPPPPGELPRLLARRAELGDRRDVPGWLRELADRFRVRTATVPAAGRWAAPLERAADLLDLRRRFARELP